MKPEQAHSKWLLLLLVTATWLATVALLLGLAIAVRLMR